MNKQQCNLTDFFDLKNQKSTTDEYTRPFYSVVSKNPQLSRHIFYNGWYVVNTQNIAPHIIQEIVKDLTIIPQTLDKTSDPQTVPKSYKLYRRKGKWLYMPRFYGSKRFGYMPTEFERKQSKLTLGKPFESDLKFNANLRESKYQPQAAQACIKALTSANRAYGGMLCLPCGFGKTVVSIYVASKLQRKTLIIVHMDTLVDQWKERIEEFLPGARVGIIRQNKCQIKEYDFSIALIHSLYRRKYDDLDDFGTIIIDEAHHMAAPTFSQVLMKFKAKHILGLSATPVRLDQTHHVLHWLMGPIVFKTNRKAGECVQVTMLRYKNTKHVEMRYGKGPRARLNTQGMLRKMSLDKKRNHLLLTHLEEMAQNTDRHIIIFSKLLKHLDLLMDTFCSKNPHFADDVGLLTGQVKQKYRSAAKTKRIIFCTPQLGDEGLDIPSLNTLIMALPTGNTEQLVGRILRKAKTRRQMTYSDVVPHVYDIWDQFSLYFAMGVKRQRVYQKFQYDINYNFIQWPPLSSSSTLLSSKLHLHKQQHKDTQQLTITELFTQQINQYTV